MYYVLYKKVGLSINVVLLFIFVGCIKNKHKKVLALIEDAENNKFKSIYQRPGICVKHFLSFPQKNLSPEKTGWRKLFYFYFILFWKTVSKFFYFIRKFFYSDILIETKFFYFYFYFIFIFLGNSFIFILFYVTFQWEKIILFH